MVRIGLLIVGVGCVLASATCGYLVWSAKPPGFVCADPVRDFGEMSQGQKTQTNFEVVNHYETPVEIKNVKTSCGCTDVALSAKTIQPGEKLTVTAHWSTGGARGDVSARVWLVYALADGRLGQMELAMKGTVVPDIKCSPERLVFTQEADDAQTVHFLPGRMASFQVKRLYCTHRACKASWDQKERSATISFNHSEYTIDSGGPDVYLMAETDSPNQQNIQVPIRVESRKP